MLFFLKTVSQWSSFIEDSLQEIFDNQNNVQCNSIFSVNSEKGNLILAHGGQLKASRSSWEMETWGSWGGWDVGNREVGPLALCLLSSCTVPPWDSRIGSREGGSCHKGQPSAQNHLWPACWAYLNLLSVAFMCETWVKSRLLAKRCALLFASNWCRLSNNQRNYTSRLWNNLNP